MKTPQVLELWKTQLDADFCAMTVATLFKATGLSLVVGCEDGMVRVHDFSHKVPPSPSPQTTLETKSGPIQCLVVRDVTRFYHNDLIVGDSCGMLTIFCNKQILSRQSLSADSLICLTVVENNAGSPVIVSSNDAGVVTGVEATAVLWRINLNSLSNKNPSINVKVLCLLSAEMTDASGNKRKYILAADNSRRIHLICNGMVVSSLNAPSNITAMTQGRFISSAKLGLPSVSPAASDNEQVALAGSNGAVYIMHNFQITLDDYVNARSPITSLCTVPKPDLPSDLLLCAGHFSSLNLYNEGQLLTQYPTSDWVSNIVPADVDGDGCLEVVIGCMDRTVMAIRV